MENKIRKGIVIHVHNVKWNWTNINGNIWNSYKGQIYIYTDIDEFIEYNNIDDVENKNGH